jgi:hypothetical protein
MNWEYPDENDYCEDCEGPLTNNKCETCTYEYENDEL